MGRWDDNPYTPYQQKLIEKMNANDYRWTFGPNSPNPTREDLETYVGGRYSPAGGFEGKWALAPKDYYSFSPAQRRALGIMDIAPRRQAGFLERYFGRNDRGGGISIEPGPLREPTPRDWAAVSPQSWAEPTPGVYPFTGEPAPYNPPPSEFMYPTPVSSYYNPPPVEFPSYPSPLDFSNPAPNEAMYPTPIGEFNPAPNEDMLPTPVDTYYPGDLSNPAPNEESPFYVDQYLPGDDTSGGGGGGAPARSYLPPMPSGSVPLNTHPAKSMWDRIKAEFPQNMGGWGQPMGFFGVPQMNAPGSYGVGGMGGSFYGGAPGYSPMGFGGSDLPGIYSGPLPGSFGPYFGGGGGPTQLWGGGAPTGMGIGYGYPENYGEAEAGGGPRFNVRRM